MSVEVLFNHFPSVGAAIEAGLGVAVQASAERIRTAASEAVPVDTGALRGTIEAHEAGPNTWEVTAGRGLPDAHAVYVEYGTGARGEASQFEGKPSGIPYKSGWPGMQAQPYMTPAVESERPNLPRGLTVEIETAINGVVRS